MNDLFSAPQEHSYESAPATELLATHCGVCGKKLVESLSVETGIGPICRKKYGFDSTVVSQAARDEANKLIYRAAVLQKGVEFLAIAKRLAQLGFTKLSEILTTRARVNVEVKISLHPATAPVYYRIEAPYNAGAVADLKAIPGRKYGEVEETLEGGKVIKHKYNFIPVARKQLLFDAISRHYAGLTAEGPKGTFVIEPLQ